MTRYKRFFADVELPSGEVVVTHCPNPGSMRTCAPDRARVWISRASNPKRKLGYTWELVEACGGMVVVNTGLANRVVAEALQRGVIEELTGYDTIQPEVRYGERSRVDFLLSRKAPASAGGLERCWVEVKSVTLHAGGTASAFPDSVTARGTRHLEELVGVVEAGDRAVMLFCVGRDPTDVVRPADDIDPVYGATLRRAAEAGVEILAYRCEVSPTGVELLARVPVDLSCP